MTNTNTARRMSPPAYLLALPIRFYRRWISRYTPPSCRYHPCCSSYALQALREHGAVKGVLLTGWRLLRCHPWSAGGVDHIPERGRWKWNPPADDDVPYDEEALASMDVIAGGDGPQSDAAGAPDANRVIPEPPAAAGRAAATTSRRFAA